VLGRVYTLGRGLIQGPKVSLCPDSTTYSALVL
jgi:hypothetical protein